MKPTHTPGPWKSFLYEDGGFWIEPPGEDGTVITSRNAWNNRRDESLANGRLIAAAPDLLAACQAFVTAWKKPGQLEKTDAALRMAEMAIEKALGKEARP